MAQVLGLKTARSYPRILPGMRGVRQHINNNPMNLARVHSLMVYTDIVESRIVGDVKVPLLRSFPFEHRNYQLNNRFTVNQCMNHKTFDHLIFRRLNKSHFHSVHIELRSQTGELIPFISYGVVRLTLLFRKADNGNLPNTLLKRSMFINDVY